MNTSHDLPPDVFTPGEVRPEKPKKKTVIKKRPLDSSNAEVCYSERLRDSLPGSTSLGFQVSKHREIC